MAKEIGFKKWSRGWTCGLPTDSPHALFLGLLKSVPGLCEMDQKRPCVKCRKLFEVNGLICVEMDRLMHELCVLT